MGYKNQMLNYTAAFALSTTILLSGCFGGVKDYSSNNSNLEPNHKVEKAMDKFDTSYRNIEQLPGGYKTTKPVASMLETMAGIKAGTVDVKKSGDKYLMQGTFSRINNAEELERICAKADEDDNYLISAEEARGLKRNLLETYAKK